MIAPRGGLTVAVFLVLSVCMCRSSEAQGATEVSEKPVCRAAVELMRTCPKAAKGELGSPTTGYVVKSVRACHSLANPPQWMHYLDLTKQGEYDIEGFTCDGDGEALSGVTVRVIRLKSGIESPVARGAFSEGDAESVDESVADEQGHFTASGLPSGAYLLDVEGAGSRVGSRLVFSIAVTEIP